MVQISASELYASLRALENEMSRMRGDVQTMTRLGEERRERDTERVTDIEVRTQHHQKRIEELERWQVRVAAIAAVLGGALGALASTLQPIITETVVGLVP